MSSKQTNTRPPLYTTGWLLRETLRQIGPATFEDVKRDLLMRVKIGAESCTTDAFELSKAWTQLEVEGLIGRVEGSANPFLRQWLPTVAMATSGAKATQMALFGDDDN